MDSVAEINLTCNGKKVVVEQFFYMYTPSIWFRRRDLDTSGLHVWGVDPRAVECLSDCAEREREREREREFKKFTTTQVHKHFTTPPKRGS
jgi:hypothetical protein